MLELAKIIEEMRNNSQAKGLVIGSKKEKGFIAGADISQFKFSNIKEAAALIKQGQSIINSIASLTIPTLSMINGFCFGGGLEIPLACDYRIADKDARFGFLEAKAGILPAWGGSTRMPDLVGAKEGLNLILSGHTVNSKVAKNIGFIDHIVPNGHLKNAAKKYIVQKPPRHRPTWLQIVSNVQPFRSILASNPY